MFYFDFYSVMSQERTMKCRIFLNDVLLDCFCIKIFKVIPSDQHNLDYFATLRISTEFIYASWVISCCLSTSEEVSDLKNRKLVRERMQCGHWLRQNWFTAERKGVATLSVHWWANQLFMWLISGGLRQQCMWGQVLTLASRACRPWW